MQPDQISAKAEPDQKNQQAEPDQNPAATVRARFAFGELRSQPSPDSRYSHWIDQYDEERRGTFPRADIRDVGLDCGLFAALVERSPRLLVAFLDCVEALEAAGASGEPGDMPAPALDRARLLIAEFEAVP